MDYFNTFLPPGDLETSGVLFLMLMVNLALLVLWLWLIIDCARRTFRSPVEKAAWILAMIFVPVIAPIAYLIVIKYNNPQGIMEK